mmetsp:Transcript_22572/g.31829  ORF Transcript_22572/g.31829 Transcript_22572/m.31829 type:complete len:1053 (-) Transcript_22572:372-3530(-)
MDDNEALCPICCEELDISDQQFFPCKCGYQVCMWCWHRIKESESGLCPACRTPYGDDPHEFSAVDMEEVVKVNKEKAAAEKREKERLRQQQAAAAGVSGAALCYGGVVPGVGGMHISGGSDGDMALALAGGNRCQMEAPKDRNQLANMRVIRRNLVYAVGLPPSIATEEMLRKPEYFGQYGKISKIVINRNHNGNGDPRRASASAYLTFVHKEDTLACILALDGFYVDGRNIRASYGTSKYCSAFVKNVRCNNPDCTYLHCMGDSDDTFAKQEIQAGYVTSGRDVMARQQQQQQQITAVSNSATSSRRRIGGGGPSGTGKPSSTPVFPPPAYDEPTKSQSNLLVPPPPSTSSTTQFPPVGSTTTTKASSVTASVQPAFGSGPSAASIAAGKAVRSVSLSNVSSTTSTVLHQNSASSSIASTSSQKQDNSLTPAELLSRQQEQLRKMHPQNSAKSLGAQKKTSLSSVSPLSNSIERSVSLPMNSPSSITTPVAATAASVVAGVHASSSYNRTGTSQPAPHKTLTSLTSLKRATSFNEKKDSSFVNNFKSVTNSNQNILAEQKKENNLSILRQERDVSMKLSSLRNSSTSLGNSHHSHSLGVGIGTAHSSPTSSISSASGPSIPPIKSNSISNDNTIVGPGAIGGSILGGTTTSPGMISGTIGAPLNRSISLPLTGGLGSIGAVGSDNTGNGGIILGQSNSSSLGLGSILGTNLNNSLGGQSIGGFNGSKTIDQNGVIGSTTSKTNAFLNGVNNEQNAFLGRPIGDTSLNDSSKGIWGEELSKRSSGPTPIGPSNSNVVGLASGDGINSVGGDNITNKFNSSSGTKSTNRQSLKSFTSPETINNSGSSALASMLGIELPTGTGSLRESLWNSSTPVIPPVGAVNNSAPVPTPIGSGIKPNNGVIIGGGYNMNSSTDIPIGGFGSSISGGNSIGNGNDIAVLQSLLPGVHITSGNAYQPAASTNVSFNSTGWSQGSSLSTSHHQQDAYQLNESNNMYQHPYSQQRCTESWNNDNTFSSQRHGQRSEPRQQEKQFHHQSKQQSHNQHQQQQHPGIW